MRGVVGVLLLAGCVPTEAGRLPDPRPCQEAVPVAPVAAVRAALAQFVVAVERKDFSHALSLLDGSVRRRYSSERLQRDFLSEPRSAVLLSRARAATEAPVEIEGDRARIEVAEREFTVLHFESGAWHIVSLDGELTLK